MSNVSNIELNPIAQASLTTTGCAGFDELPQAVSFSWDHFHINKQQTDRLCVFNSTARHITASVELSIFCISSLVTCHFTSQPPKRHFLKIHLHLLFCLSRYRNVIDCSPYVLFFFTNYSSTKITSYITHYWTFVVEACEVQRKGSWTFELCIFKV